MADRTPNELAGLFNEWADLAAEGYGPVDWDDFDHTVLREAAVLLRRQGEQLNTLRNDNERLLGTLHDYTGTVSHWRNRYREAESQLDTLRAAIETHRESALCNGTMYLADRERALWDALDALAAAVPQDPEGAET